MKKTLLLTLMGILAGMLSSAQNTILMPLPPQATTYTGAVRGYWFTSPTCFTITGLEVPTDASTGLQNIAVVRLDSVPPQYPTTTNAFTVLYLTQNNTATGMIPVSIQVGVGDRIAILGNRGDINSYGTPANPTHINNFPVDIFRFGMQFPLSTDTLHDLWSLPTGSISRVFMYYDTTYTFSVNASWQGGTSYSFTNGATAAALSIWDYGDGTPLDTAYNPTHTYASPGNYTVCSYITGNCVSDTACTTVIICPAPALADYSYSITYPTVDFTDNSQNAASWLWDFGDGTTSTQQNPSHSYATFGLYTVCLTVTDTCGGTQSKCEDISVCPALLPVSLGNDITACGSALVTLPGYNGYAWSNGATTAQITVTASGDYSVVVTDAAGCSGTDTVNVTVNPLPTVNLGNDVTQCGGSVLLDAQNSGNTFLWSNGATTQTITASASGTYTVTVTNGLGCTNSDNITLTLLPVPPAALGNDITVCQGNISISVPSTPGATYLWSTGSVIPAILINSGGIYWVRVTGSNGCSASDTVQVTMNAPAVTYIETQTLLCVTASPITLTPGTPAGGTYSGPGVTGNQFDPAVAGVGAKNIIYAFTDTAGCVGRDTSIITVDPCSGISENPGNGIQLYPNPGSGLFHLEWNGKIEEIIISDSRGRWVERIIPSQNQVLLNLEKEPEGLYFLKVRGAEKEQLLPLIIAR